MVALLLGLGLGWPVQVRIRVLGDKEGFGGFRVLKMEEEGKEWKEVSMVFGGTKGNRETI